METNFEILDSDFKVGLLITQWKYLFLIKRILRSIFHSLAAVFWANNEFCIVFLAV